MRFVHSSHNTKYVVIAIFLFCLVLIAPTKAYAAPQKYEECFPGTEQFTPVTMDGRWRAQTFTAISTHSVTSVKVRIIRYGSPGEVVLSIRNTDLGGPTGSDLAAATLSNPGSQGVVEWVEFVFPSACTAEEGKVYSIIIRTPAAPYPVNDFVGWAAHYTDQCPGGNHWYSDNDGFNWDPTDYDQHFEVWGEPAQPSPPAPAQGVPALSQWGMVVMAALFALLLVWLVTKRLGSKGTG